MESSSNHRYDIVIAGAGILGVSLAFWLSEIYSASILLVDREREPAQHTSSRNTGVIHRPFYLDPEKKKIFARTSQKSYHLWKKLAQRYSLPWKETGILEVALEEAEMGALEKYRRWSLENGMDESETELLQADEVQKLEPLVKCRGAIHSKTDASVNFAQFTEQVFRLAQESGVQFLGGYEISKIREKDDMKLFLRSAFDHSSVLGISCGAFLNAAGGGSLDIAHKMELAEDATDLHFRGEYWQVSESFGSKIRTNIYTVPKFAEFPFLDPHLIVRANGTREIGPNAVLVSGPFAYRGLSSSKSEFVQKIFERPLVPKAKLFVNRRFLSLAWAEWRSSLSKKAMCNRVRDFIPELDSAFLVKRGLAGVRSSVINGRGFVAEVLLAETPSSIHILNYNSPGATGAPAFSAYVVAKAQERGLFGNLRKRDARHSDLWSFQDASVNAEGGQAHAESAQPQPRAL